MSPVTSEEGSEGVSQRKGIVMREVGSPREAGLREAPRCGHSPGASRRKSVSSPAHTVHLQGCFGPKLLTTCSTVMRCPDTSGGEDTGLAGRRGLHGCPSRGFSGPEDCSPEEGF